MIKRTINGTEVALNYYLKYFGFYNFHVLGMWQASQNKDIIEAATRWEMPEIRTSINNVWRTGDERYPSYVNYYKEPLARVKLSADGKTLASGGGDLSIRLWNVATRQEMSSLVKTKLCSNALTMPSTSMA